LPLKLVTTANANRAEAFADANFLLDNQNCEVPVSEEADF